MSRISYYACYDCEELTYLISPAGYKPITDLCSHCGQKAVLWSSIVKEPDGRWQRTDWTCTDSYDLEAIQSADYAEIETGTFNTPDEAA